MYLLDYKIKTPGFFCGCDRDYFNLWTKVLVKSIQHRAPWAAIHIHLFDATTAEIEWCKNNNCTVTFEKTGLTDLEQKRAFYSNYRWIRAINTFDATTPFVCQDADSILVKDLSKEEFLSNLKESWVPIAPKRVHKSLASAAGFGLDDARNIFYFRMMSLIELKHYTDWADDQVLFDTMLEDGSIKSMDLRFTDFKFGDNSYIWTGKGDRKYKTKFQELVTFYKLQA